VSQGREILRAAASKIFLTESRPLRQTCAAIKQGRLINFKKTFMMPYGYNWSMMSGFGFFCFITWLVVIVDLVLLGAWLWKQIKK